jgi:hypothetical protein
MRQRDEAIEVSGGDIQRWGPRHLATPHPSTNCSQSVSHLCGCHLNINNPRVLDRRCCTI